MKRVVEALSCNGLLWMSQHLNSSLFNENVLHLILPAFALQVKYKTASWQVSLYVFAVPFISTKGVGKLFNAVCQHNLSLAVNLIYFSCDLLSYIFKWHTGAN